MQTILTPELLDQAFQLVATILGALLSWAIWIFKQKTGYEIEVQKDMRTDMLRRRLSEVIYRGVDHAIALGQDAAKSQVENALTYVLRGAGDTVTALGANEEILRKRIAIELSHRSLPIADEGVRP